MENPEIKVEMAVNGVEGVQANSNSGEKSEDEDEEQEEEEEVKYDTEVEEEEEDRKLGSPLSEEESEEESEDEGLDEVVHEHEVRLQELREKEAKSTPATIENSSDLEKRMEYLVSA